MHRSVHGDPRRQARVIPIAGCGNPSGVRGAVGLTRAASLVACHLGWRGLPRLRPALCRPGLRVCASSEACAARARRQRPHCA